MITKKLLKQSMLKKRDNLTKTEVEEKSKKIFEKVFGLDCYKSAKNVFIYYSFKNEVSTKSAIKEMLKTKSVFIPKINNNDLMIAVKIETDTKFCLNRYGIAEPESNKTIEKKDIDLCIVPGAAFDKFGGRTGYGKAYYDMFLRGTKMFKLAICYDFQLIDYIPVDLLDVNMDNIVTEEKILIPQRK